MIDWRWVFQKYDSRVNCCEDALKVLTKLYRTKSLTQIANLLDGRISYNGIRNFLRRQGVPIKKRGGAHGRPRACIDVKVTKEEFFTLTYDEMAKRHQCSVSTIIKSTKQYRPAGSRKPKLLNQEDINA